MADDETVGVHLDEFKRLRGEFERLPLGDDPRLTRIRNELITVIELALPEAQASRFISQVEKLSFEPISYSRAQYDRNRRAAWEAAKAQMVGIIEAVEHGVALLPKRPAALDLSAVEYSREPIASPTAISYVRGYRDEDVHTLAAELRDNGIPCELDIYQHGSPDGGWSRHMVRLMKSPFVIVVCSRGYYERYALEDTGGGGGVTMESGLLSRRFADSKGRDHGIIPVIFDDEDAQWRPDFLRDETYYILPRERSALYAILTNQRLHQRPPLGVVRRVVPETAKRWNAAPDPLRVSPRRLMLVNLEDGAFLMPYARLVRDASKVDVTLLADDSQDAGHAAALRQYAKPFSIAWNLDAAVVRSQNYRESVSDDRHQIELELTEEGQHSGAWVDLAYNGISADQLAVMRARRILLDERLREATGLPFSMDDWRALELESFVAGRFVFGGALTAKGSPLPMVAELAKSDTDLLDAGRLWCAMLLRLSGTVDRITKLNPERLPEGLRVDFTGYRAKVSENEEPFRIDVSGVCPIP